MPTFNVQPRSNIIGYETDRYPSPSAEIETKSAMTNVKPQTTATSSSATNTNTDTDTNSANSLSVSNVTTKRYGPRITFNVRVAVKETIHRDDYTAEELFYTWYRKNDFSKMKQNFAYTVQLLAANRYQGDTDEMTSRGLEYRFREGATKRKANKLNALYAVLDEQERQWQEGYENDVELSHVYIQNNVHCRTAAHIMGQKDEEMCKEINGLNRRAFPESFDDDDMSVSSNEDMDLVKDDDHPRQSKSKAKTVGFARFFKKEQGR